MRDTSRPTPTRDLDTPGEIAEMVRRFYADVSQDDLLGPMFNEVAHVDWSEHLPKLAAFWCRALLGQQGYEGNPYRAHALVHAKREFTAAHFERWLTLFHETLDLGWIGPNAQRARDLADNVARVHSHQLLGQAVSPRRRASRRASRPIDTEDTSGMKRSGASAERPIRSGPERGDIDMIDLAMTRVQAGRRGGDHV